MAYSALGALMEPFVAEDTFGRQNNQVKYEPVPEDKKDTELKDVPIAHEHVVEMPVPEVLIPPEANEVNVGPQNLQAFVPALNRAEFYKNTWFGPWMFLISLILIIPPFMITFLTVANYCDVIQSRIMNMFISSMILVQLVGAAYGLRRDGGSYGFIMAFSLIYYFQIYADEISKSGTVYSYHCGQMERTFLAFYWMSIIVPPVLIAVLRCVYVTRLHQIANAPIVDQQPGLHLRDMVYTFPFCSHNLQGQPRPSEPEQNAQLNETHDKCSICSSDYVVGERILELPCHHMYHCSCVSTWFDRSHKCPTCNHDYTFN
jgi:hypothetical protein